MIRHDKFHVVTVGWAPDLIERLFNRVADESSICFSHIVHPRYSTHNWPEQQARTGVYFFCENMRQELPEADVQLLTSLEQDGVPSVHNMIMGDRVVSKLEYGNALRYATFVANRLFDLFSETKPSVVIGGFDAVHGGLALGTARYLDIPWFALHFSVIPPGFACFCDRMSPAARVTLRQQNGAELKDRAKSALQSFQNREIEAHAYIAPDPLPLGNKVTKIPSKLVAMKRTIRKSRDRNFLQFTDEQRSLSVLDMAAHYRRTARARKAILDADCTISPPTDPYILFGLHMQPESSIDVWAPFFSNQMWVIELLSRSVSPTHKILVKIHKSDVSNYSNSQLEKMQSFPGIELVRPFSDSRSFIENADLLIAIQGTMALEAALIGKPVIMLADSAVTMFPSVSQIRELPDLPALIKRKLKEPAPAEDEIIVAFASFLAPFLPASHNDWTANIELEQIRDYVDLFSALRSYLITSDGAGQRESEDAKANHA